MRKIIVIYNQFTIVTVPFPFVDSKSSKKRPAIILSSHNYNKNVGHSIMAMITSARNAAWPYDTEITDLSKAGLPKASVIRMKLFTIDHRLILEILGTLSAKDQKMLSKTIHSVLKGFF